MKKKHIILFLLLAAYASAIQAQTISMDFPKFRGKTYELVIFQGSQSIKVVQDTIPSDGKFELNIPKQYAPYTGMCRWLLTNSKEGGGLDMAIPGHSFSVSCLSDTPTNDNIVYTGYDPINPLNSLYGKQQKIIDKFQTMYRAAHLYGKDSPLHTVFENEMEKQQQAFDDFRMQLKTNPDYPAKFLSIVNITQGIPPHLSGDEGEISKSITDYIVNELDFKDLYTSGHWPAVIDTWVQIASNAVANDMQFLNDFIKIGNRIKEPQAYTDFVAVVTKSLTRLGKDSYIERLSPVIRQSGKITGYEGILSVYNSISTGMQAPDLVITEHIGNPEEHHHKVTVLKSSELATGGYTKSLLIFYESGCGPCEELMQQLPGNYPQLKNRGVRIIAIAADQSEQMFKNTSFNFPWKDTYCDFEGKRGVNFKSYAVVGTPTIFLIDKQGKITAKMATLQEVLDKLK